MVGGLWFAARQRDKLVYSIIDEILKNNTGSENVRRAISEIRARRIQDYDKRLDVVRRDVLRRKVYLILNTKTGNDYLKNSKVLAQDSGLKEEVMEQFFDYMKEKTAEPGFSVSRIYDDIFPNSRR
ncbi:MAG: hypothetical protein ABIE55_01310 [Candidatus Aenigmatarchaeota archaeon]